MVMTPTSRLSVSTTGAATRLYLPNIRATSSWSSSTETRRRSSSTSSFERHHAARAQQQVERNRALPALVGIDGVDFIEPVRQIGRLTHVVDRLAHGPIRRHRDELGLHPPAGGIFRIFEGALDDVAFGRRQLFENLFAVLLVQQLQDLDGVVRFELPDALGDLFRLELFEDLLADGLVDLVQRREVEIRAGQFDQVDAVVRLQRRDQVAEIGLMQFRDNAAQERGIGRLDGARDRLDKFRPDLPFIVPHRMAVEQRGLVGMRNIGIVGHAAPSPV